MDEIMGAPKTAGAAKRVEVPELASFRPF
jgi:hypothetical protein